MNGHAPRVAVFIGAAMPDEYQPHATPVIAPDKPLGIAIEDHPSKNVAVAEIPVVALPAVDYEAARSLINVMEGELETIRQEAEYDTDLLVAKLRRSREATARKFLDEDKRLSCVVAADKDGIMLGLMAEFDQALAELRKEYTATLLRFTEHKREHLLQLREVLLFDGIR